MVGAPGRWESTLSLVILCVGCGAAPKPAKPPSAKPAPAPVVAVATPPRPEPPLRAPRTGKWDPVEDPRATLRVVARRAVGDVELLSLRLPTPAELAPGVSLGTGTWVGLDQRDGTLAFIGMASANLRGDGAIPGAASRNPAAGASRGGASPFTPMELRLWVRRPRSEGAITGTFYTDASMSGVSGPTHGHRIPFTAAVEKDVLAPPDLERQWAVALATDFETRSGAFFRFAAARTRSRYLGATPKKSGGARFPGYRREGDLSELMDTLTGRLSVQEALQRDRDLFLQAARQKPSVSVDSLRPPALTPHPWEALSRALRVSAPEESLAKATPAEFYFVRARSVGALFDVVDAVEQWGEPAADFLDGRTEDRGTFARYQTELGLERTSVTRLLGPELVRDLAIVGSDPYVHEGTDLTVLFHVKNAALFRAGLAGVVAKLGGEHGGVTESTFVHEGVTVTVERSADGRLRRHRAGVGDLEIVSNSPGAIRRVLSTLAGKHDRLSDEPDFAYMLARDRDAPDDVLAYLGDRFVAAVVGPKQKVGEARRQLALSELTQPGYAALLHGWIEGRSPKTADALVRSKLLDKSELRHGDGAAIEWSRESGARSRWGTTAALEPLIDLPEVTRVTEAERQGYESFARAYESLWSDKLDPVAMRIRDTMDGDRTVLGVELRVLPLLRNDYRELLGMVGDARASVPGIGSGARLVLGIGTDAELRRELTSSGRSFGFGKKLAFDWLGDYALVGVANRTELSNAVLEELGEYVEMPGQPRPERTEEIASSLVDLPVYAAVAVKTRLGAALALAAARELGEREARGVARWGTAPAYRGNEISTVTGREAHHEITLYYSLLPNALVMSLNEGAMHGAIDQLLDAPPIPRSHGENVDPGAAQTVFELAFDAKTPLYRAIAWAATAALFDRPSSSGALAEAVLRGDPEAAKSPEGTRSACRALFGTVPLTLEGRDFVLGADGIGFPPRGSANAPVWPEVPTPGSSLERVLQRLSRLRTALSFDEEPVVTADSRAFQSLHARVTLELRELPPSER